MTTLTIVLILKIYYIRQLAFEAISGNFSAIKYLYRNATMIMTMSPKNGLFGGFVLKKPMRGRH
jgi:hypothetical protein